MLTDEMRSGRRRAACGAWRGRAPRPVRRRVGRAVVGRVLSPLLSWMGWGIDGRVSGGAGEVEHPLTASTGRDGTGSKRGGGGQILWSTEGGGDVCHEYSTQY